MKKKLSLFLAIIIILGTFTAFAEIPEDSIIGKSLGRLISINEIGETEDGWFSNGNEKKVMWEVYINETEQILENNHTIKNVLDYQGIIDSDIKVFRYETVNGDKIIGEELESDIFTILPSEYNDNEFSIVFNSQISEKYVIVFTTSVMDMSLFEYRIITTLNANEKEYNYLGSLIFPEAANNLSVGSMGGNVNGKINPNDEVEWNIKFNGSLSIQKEAKFIITLSDNWIVKEDNFEVFKIKGTEKIEVKQGEDKEYNLQVKNLDGGKVEFTIDFNNIIDSTYEIQYVTKVTGTTGFVNTDIYYSWKDNLFPITMKTGEITIIQNNETFNDKSFHTKLFLVEDDVDLENIDLFNLKEEDMFFFEENKNLELEKEYEFLLPSVFEIDFKGETMILQSLEHGAIFSDLEFNGRENLGETGMTIKNMGQGVTIKVLLPSDTERFEAGNVHLYKRIKPSITVKYNFDRDKDNEEETFYYDTLGTRVMYANEFEGYKLIGEERNLVHIKQGEKENYIKEISFEYEKIENYTILTNLKVQDENENELYMNKLGFAFSLYKENQIFYTKDLDVNGKTPFYNLAKGIYQLGIQAIPYGYYTKDNFINVELTDGQLIKDIDFIIIKPTEIPTPTPAPAPTIPLTPSTPITSKPTPSKPTTPEIIATTPTPTPEEIPPLIDLVEGDFVSRWLFHKPIEEKPMKNEIKQIIKVNISKEQNTFMKENGLSPRLYYWHKKSGRWVALSTINKPNRIETYKEIDENIWIATFGIKQPTFVDVTGYEWYVERANRANGLAIIEGRPTKEGTVVLDAQTNIDRKEFYAMIGRIFGAVPKGQTSLYNELDFIEQGKGGNWYKPYIQEFYDKQIISKIFDEKESKEDITRQEVAMLLTRMLERVGEEIEYINMKDFKDTQHLENLKIANIINGYEDKTLRLDQTITRIEAITLLLNALENLGW